MGENRVKRIISKYALLVIAIFFLIGNTGAAGVEVTVLTADVFVVKGQTVLEGAVNVQFGDQSLYNEQVKLSWHIYDASGTLLSFENERVAFSYSEGGTDVPVRVDLSSVASAHEQIIVRFDLVDEQNVYWFADNPYVAFQAAEVTVDLSGSGVAVESYGAGNDTVKLTADFPLEISRGKLEGNVNIFFANPEWYHDQLKLSWHVYNEDGTDLAFENQRLPIPEIQNGASAVFVSIDFSDSGAMSEGKFFVVFDVVDEKNGFWFSDYPEILFETVQASYRYSLLNELVANFHYVVTQQTLVLILNLLIVFALIGCFVFFKTAKGKV